MPLLFVYGSLKTGFPNEHINAGVRQAGVFRTHQRLPLYLLGEGHVPCLAIDPGNGHRVIGELYEASEAALSAMDRLERLGEPDGYLRVEIEVECVDGAQPRAIRALVYAKTAEQVAHESSRAGPFAEYTLEHARRFKWRGAD